MERSFVRQVIFPILAAFIWGTAFVAQSVAADLVPPFLFNALRSFVAVLFLLLVSRVFDTAAAKRGTPPPKTDRKELLKAGLCCGVVLAASINFQQSGLADTSAGKAGFITAFYVVLVPVLGIFLKKRAGVQVWIGVLFAVAGLYFLCLAGKEGFRIRLSDLYVLLCAFFFSCHILCIDHFAPKVDGIKLSCAQFFVAGIISAALSLRFETVVWSDVARCIGPILYLGVGSSGVAYTLQVLSQNGSNPAVVSLLFSLESVFSAVADAMILRVWLTPWEYLGCALMFAAVILAQIPLKSKEKRLQ